MKKYGRRVNVEGFRDIFPFRPNYKKINGLCMHYLDEGHGQPVLMIHGNPTWSFFFRNIVKNLPKGFRAIVPDHIGCGLSDKPPVSVYPYRLENRVKDIEALIDELEIKEKIHLLVHDWGGMIGSLFALRNLEKIASITVTNTSGFLPPGTKELPLRLKIVRNLTAFSKPAVLAFNLFAGSALYMAPKKPLSQKTKKGMIAPYSCIENRISTYRFVQDIPIDDTHPSYSLVKWADDNLHRLSEKPMQIIWGEHDFVFDTDYFNEWVRRFPDKKAYFFKSAGHYLFEDEPEKISGLINTFLIGV